MDLRQLTHQVFSKNTRGYMHLQTSSANSLARMALKNSLQAIFFAAILFASSYVNAEEVKEEDEGMGEFPPGFLFGASTSSYQIEGAWNISDKGVNSWDHYTHTYPDRIHDKSNGDIACDSYNKYAEDAQAAQDIGLDYYRFSLSWARILPEGYANVISKDGIAYYHKVLDELEKRNITPLVTLYHWDHPQMFQEMGGWTNELMVEWFSDYARVVFKEFGHRVKQWITINEPNAVCIYAYVYGSSPPGLKLGSHAAYVCNQNVLKGHASVYHIYKDEFDAKNEGKMGITLELRNYFPKTENDTEAAEIGFQYQFGVYAHPIYSKTGDWPDLLKKRIAEHSKEEGLPRSRLPEFSPYWIKHIQGSADFLGLNHYSSLLVELAPKRIVGTDDGLIATFDSAWPATTYGWLKIVPHGFLNALRRIKKEYNNPEIWVTENGVPDHGVIEDNERLDYLHGYIKNMLIAINKYHVNVKRYTVWSLLDNFEWYKGYVRKFGLYQVDFSSPNKTRTPKNSVKWLREVIKGKHLLPTLDYAMPEPQQTSIPCMEGTPNCGEEALHSAPAQVDIWYRD